VSAARPPGFAASPSAHMTCIGEAASTWSEMPLEVTAGFNVSCTIECVVRVDMVLVANPERHPRASG
jgi:hypothetical protein